MATRLPVSGSHSTTYGSPSASILSAANALRKAMEMGSSTILRRHASSQGCGHTRPMEAGSGKASYTVETASL